MVIYGIRCAYCSGELEMLNTVNGAVHTRCVQCEHISRPEIKSTKQNAVYSKFAGKSVDVEYSRPRPELHKPISGTYRRVS